MELWADLEKIACWITSVCDKCEVLMPEILRDMVTEKLKNNKYGI